MTRSAGGPHGSPAAGRGPGVWVARSGERGPGSGRHDNGNAGGWPLGAAHGPGDAAHGPRVAVGFNGLRDRETRAGCYPVWQHFRFGCGRPFCDGHKKARHWAGLGEAGAG